MLAAVLFKTTQYVLIIKHATQESLGHNNRLFT